MFYDRYMTGEVKFSSFLKSEYAISRSDPEIFEDSKIRVRSDPKIFENFKIRIRSDPDNFESS